MVGVEDDFAKKTLEKLYHPWTEKGTPLVITNIKTAEIIKYAANAMLATKISFINEIANFCERCDANVREVSRGIGLDKRIGDRFLHAGIGYGGSCFPKDVNALIETGKDYGYEFKIIRAAEDVNNKQKEILYKKLLENMGPIHNKKIAIWGLSFKPKTDDMRDAPAITIIKRLYAEGAGVSVFDPVAIEVAKESFKGLKIDYAKTAYGALQDADALMILTEWDEFRSVDLKRVKELMRGAHIFDGRNVFERDDVEAAGLIHFCMGKKDPENRIPESIHKAAHKTSKETTAPVSLSSQP